MSHTTADEPQLIVKRSGPIGRITLNSPKALSNLTLEMMRGKQATLDSFEGDPATAAMLVSGESERGLWASGRRS